MLQQISASAPGSIMITGEHAVVYGYRAIVAAIAQRVTVHLTARADQNLRITSQIAGPYEAPLNNLTENSTYRFVLSALRLYLGKFPSGFDLDIQSEIDPTLGLGSSAAVTVATLGALSAFVGEDQPDLHGQALGIVRNLQGRGSGADLAASLQGGMISYQAPPHPVIAPLPVPPLLALKYVGYKTPTSEVLAQVATRMAGQEAVFNALYASMGAEADRAIAAAQAGDWIGFGHSLTAYQAMMVQLGVSDPNLDGLISDAVQSDGVLAAKISGSGLGDCVLALGALPQGWTPAELDQEGLSINA